MSGDEFSFIRCSSCNSLIPSKATRCRMCGFVLNEGGDQKNDKPKEPKRVTQKTVSIRSVELDDIRESLDDEAPAEETPVAKQPAPEKPKVTVPEPIVREQIVAEPVVEEPVEEPEPVVEELDEEPVADEQAKRGRRNRRSRKRKQPRIEEVLDEMEEEEIVVAPPPAPKPRPTKRSTGNPVMFEEAKSSHIINLTPLVGWFIGYGETKAGLTYEVRTGRFLITKEALLDSDVVLEDDTLSTPHCILKASADDGISIQDLMSENGTSVKKSNRAKFQTCDGPTPLNSGDVIKLGGTEMLVVLVPQAGKKNDDSSEG